MRVGGVELAGGITPASARSRIAAAEVRSPEPSAVADGSRLSAFVQLLERLTGREVKVVPPFAYFVSGPPRPEPKPESAPEIVMPADFDIERGADSGPLVVDITAVLRRGTADRMVLAPKGDGELALFSPVDVSL